MAPAHQFPLGTVLGLQRRLELLSWAERHEGWIAEDDFDGEYRYAGRPLAPLRALDRSGRVAYLAQLLQAALPGAAAELRRAAGGARPGRGETAWRRTSARASLLGQGALARFIADGHLAAHLRRTRLLYAARQEALLAGLERHLDGAGWRARADPGGMHLIARPVAAIAADLRRPRGRRGGRAAGHRGVAAVGLLCRPPPPARPDPGLCRHARTGDRRRLRHPRPRAARLHRCARPVARERVPFRLCSLCSEAL